MDDKFPNGVGQLTPTTGTETILTLGDVPPPFVRGLESALSTVGESLIAKIIDGLNYQICQLLWNDNGTVTRAASYERMENGSFTSSTGGTAGHLSLSGGARIVAGQGRQALMDYLGDHGLPLANGRKIQSISGTGGDDVDLIHMNASDVIFMGDSDAVENRHLSAGLHRFYTGGTEYFRIGSSGVLVNRIQSLTGDAVEVDDDLDVNGNITAVDGTFRSTRHISALYNQSTSTQRFLDLDFLGDTGGTCNFRIGRGTNNAGDVVFQIYRGNGSTSLTFQVDRNGAIIFGKLNLSGLPTSSSGLSSGDVWRDAAAGGVLKQVS